MESKKKITFVIGAGASLPFITNGKTQLSTEYLTEQLSDRGRWDAIYNEFIQNYPAQREPDYNFNVTVEEILSVINKLKEINEREISLQVRKSISITRKTDDYYGIGEINFEHILYLLDKVCNYLYDRKNSVDNILFDIWKDDDKQKQELRSKKGWDCVPFLCREVLVKAIIELWESCDKKKAIDENKQFFTSVLEQFNAVSIYSLNYDPILYEATKQIKVGDKIFKAGFSDNGKFNYKDFYKSNNLIAFLHGHIGFVPSGIDSMLLDNNYLNAQKRRISDVACGQGYYHRKGPKGIHYNVSITSGLEKFDSFYDNPYAYYIQRLSKDVMESEYIVFIGSGLGDKHVNLFASAAWMIVNGNAEVGLRGLPDERRKIIIVTKDHAKEKTTDLLITTDIGRKLFDLFKEGISFDDEKDNIFKNGYANINPNLLLYLKGTEQFFQEIWKIPNLFD